MVLAIGALAVVTGLLGVMQQVGQFQRLDFRVVALPEGLLVTHVVPRSGAARAKLNRGDLILSVDGEPVSTLADLEQAVFKSRVVTLTLRRGLVENDVAYYAPPVRVDVRYLLVAFATMFSLLVGAGVYVRRPSPHATRFFVLTATLFPTVAIAGHQETTSQELLLVRDLGRLFLPPLLVLFFGLFPVVVLRPWVRFALFVPSALVACGKVLLAVGVLSPVLGHVVVPDF